MSLLPDKSKEGVLYVMLYQQILILAYLHTHQQTLAKPYYDMVISAFVLLEGYHLNHMIYIENMNLAQELILLMLQQPKHLS